MAADFIPLDRSKQLANNIVRQAELIRELRELSDKNSDNANHMFNGSDYTVLIAQTGVSIDNAAQLTTLLGYMTEIMNSIATIAGADRLSRLDEFVARLSGQ
jgi:hypothetical protein